MNGRTQRGYWEIIWNSKMLKFLKFNTLQKEFKTYLNIKIYSLSIIRPFSRKEQTSDFSIIRHPRSIDHDLFSKKDLRSIIKLRKITNRSLNFPLRKDKQLIVRFFFKKISTIDHYNFLWENINDQSLDFSLRRYPK